jgi:FkbM family methyltransferase
MVHAFEPVPHIFERLRGHIERNQLAPIVRIHQAALSNETGWMAMTIPEPDCSNQGVGSLDAPSTANDQPGAKRVEIPALKLDDFVKKEGLTRLDFVKVDIQGAEPLFLAGGISTFNRFRPTLIMEVSPEDLARMGTDSQLLLAQVESLGYEVFTLSKRGDLGQKLDAREVPRNYYSEGVVCRPRGQRAE